MALKIVPTRKPGKMEQSRRELIIAAAAQCVVEEGIEGATLRRIAERAQVSTGMLFYYYANKKELIDAALQAASHHLTSQVDAIAGDGPAYRRIEVIFELLFTKRAPEVGAWPLWIEYWSTAARNEDYNPGHEQFAGLGRRFSKLLEGTSPANGFAPDIDPELAASLLSALVVGLGLHTTLDKNIPPERALEVAKLAISLLRGGARDGLEARQSAAPDSAEGVER